MSTINDEEIFRYGTRFREERERLGLSQAVLGKKLNTTGRTIAKYEIEETEPRISQLALFYKLGADIHYILTGVHENKGSLSKDGDVNFPSDECKYVVDTYCSTTEEGRLALTAMARALKTITIA